MILKIVSLFLVLMAVMAIFGGMRWSWLKLPKRRSNAELKKPKKCPRCGAFLVGKGGCLGGNADCPFGKDP